MHSRCRELEAAPLTLVYEDAGVPAMLAENIQRNLVETGFGDLGSRNGRDSLLRRKGRDAGRAGGRQGFIDNPHDNQFFDENFEAIAQAIADGVPRPYGNRRRSARVLPGADRGIPNKDACAETGG